MRFTMILAALMAVGGGAPALANKSAEAEAAFAANRDQDAIRLFGEAIAESAGDPHAQALAYFGRGEVLAMNRLSEQAIADFTAALALDQDPASRANVHFSRAEAYGRRQMFTEAVADYSESLKLTPGMIGVHHARGLLLNRMGRKDEALADFDAELKINPTSYRTLSARAEMLGLPPPPYSRDGDEFRNAR